MEKDQMITLSQQELMMDSATLPPPETTAEDFRREHPEFEIDGGRTDH